MTIAPGTVAELQKEELIKQKGEVREQDLPDQKLELQMIKNNAERDRLKGAR